MEGLCVCVSLLNQTLPPSSITSSPPSKPGLLQRLSTLEIGEKDMQHVAPKTALQEGIFYHPPDQEVEKSARETLSHNVLLKRTRSDIDSSVSAIENLKKNKFSSFMVEDQQPRQQLFNEIASDHLTDNYSWSNNNYNKNHDDTNSSGKGCSNRSSSSSSSGSSSRDHSGRIMFTNCSINSWDYAGTESIRSSQDIHKSFFLQKSPNVFMSPPRHAINMQTSTPITITSVGNSHKRTVEDYFLTPKPSSKNRSSILNPQSRPQKNLRNVVGTPDEVFFSDPVEPMISDDSCQCCFRLVTDAVISQRCSFCMKTGCRSCMKGCELCYELFCLHCSTSNYNNSYERILCLDCEDKTR